MNRPVTPEPRPDPEELLARVQAELLRRNLLIYGLGGIIVPFIGIKLIDMGLTLLHLT